MDKITTCVFDAYGTLFDVNAACRELSKEVGDKWNELSSLWRLRQLEYTWLRNSMKEYIDLAKEANLLWHQIVSQKSKNAPRIDSRT